ncbi:hypothetical protein CPB86DRAFT_792074 [Serendipita vermifera]|nr:hypothetical protein CPB86DRAFT_792074 [Serendipita vermifera]
MDELLCRWWHRRWHYWGHEDSGGGNRIGHSSKASLYVEGTAQANGRDIEDRVVTPFLNVILSRD